ncbi:8707_t:CDS:2, partial [Funneliformis caledonium]
DEVQIVKRRKWKVNDTITPDQYNKYFVVEPKLDEFIDKIKNSQYLLLYGLRASGKSTHIMYAMQKFLDFTKTNLNNDLKAMWISLYQLLKPQYHAGIVNNEFNQIIYASDEIRNDCLGAIRFLKNDKRYHIIHSVVTADPFSIRYLNPKGNYTSSFNVARSFPNPNFTKEEVANLYQDYSSSININIDASIISDIYNKTNGHVRLVCLCGCAIDEDLNRIIQYSTFTKMVSILKKSKAPMDLLRSQFMFDLEFHNVTPSDIDFANFLAAEGALHPHEKYSAKFKISSSLIHALILQCVIPSVYPDHPKVDLPYQNGIFVTINALKEVVK